MDMGNATDEHTRAEECDPPSSAGVEDADAVFAGAIHKA